MTGVGIEPGITSGAAYPTSLHKAGENRNMSFDLPPLGRLGFLVTRPQDLR